MELGRLEKRRLQKREWMRKQRELNPEKYRERARQWKANNREKHNAQSMAYYYKNRSARARYMKLLHLKTKYGLTEESFNKMMTGQSGCCAICEEKLTKPCVDHCHETGKVRGILCDDCNVGLGRFKDNVDNLSAAITYLEPVWKSVAA